MSMPRSAKVLIVLGSMAVVAVGGVFYSVWRGIHEQWQSRLDRAEVIAQRQVGQLCDDRRALSAKVFFQGHTHDRNAGPFLASKLGYQGSDGGVPPLDEQMASGLVGATEIVKRMKSEDGFSDHALDAVSANWLEGLNAFDHWELTGDYGPMTIGGSWTFESVPMPRMVDLQIWSRLYLAQHMQQGQLEAAAGTVEHVAWLCYSTETLLGLTMAASLLRLERHAFEAARERGLDAGQLQPWTEGETDRLKYWGRHGSRFVHPTVDDATFARADRCGAPPVGRCAALTELAAGLAPIEGLVTDEPWKTRLAQRLAIVARHDDAQCRFALARAAVAHRGRPPALDGIPLESAYVGDLLLAVGAPDVPLSFDGGY